MKKCISAILAVLTLTGTVCYADYHEDYPWAVEAVDYCIENHILQGDENGDLMLGEPLTQAQVAALLTRSLELKSTTKKNIIIKSLHWAKEYIEKLSGYLVLPEMFEADKEASREMFISAIASVCGLEPEEDISEFMKSFRDVSKIQVEYLPYIAAAYKNHIVEGDGENINPTDGLKRVEAITMLYRTIKDRNEAAEKTPLLGPAQYSCEQAQKWAEAHGATDAFIAGAEIYWKYGEIFGIRPEVLYLQSAKETACGNYGGRVTVDMNNWAGIKKYGATGSATDDFEVFATPDDGIRGHFNHMSAYVGVEPCGETHGRYASVKSLPWAGTIKYVEELSGTWCPEPTYGPSIVERLKELSNY